jgi:hypothetical protein
MSRKTFLTISAALGVLFGIYMLVAPTKMMEGMGTSENAVANVVLQAFGVVMLAIAAILFFARNDEGSPALKAILIGSIIMHFGDLPVDWIAYSNGTFTQISGLIPGTIVHVLLGIGFIYYLMRLSQADESSQKHNQAVA